MGMIVLSSNIPFEFETLSLSLPKDKHVSHGQIKYSATETTVEGSIKKYLTLLLFLKNHNRTINKHLAIKAVQEPKRANNNVQIISVSSQSISKHPMIRTFEETKKKTTPMCFITQC